MKKDVGAHNGDPENLRVESVILVRKRHSPKSEKGTAAESMWPEPLMVEMNRSALRAQIKAHYERGHKALLVRVGAWSPKDFSAWEWSIK